MLRLNAHAMGACRRRIYTNSLEAFKESFSHGFRDFEVDVNLTRDNKFVVSHDRKRLQAQSYAEFMADRCVGIQGQGAGFLITGGTPLDLDGVFLLLKEHEDVHVMFDFQPAALDLDADNLLHRFCEQFTDESIVGRCMIEVFNERQVDIVKTLHNLVPILWIGPSTWGTSLKLLIDITCRPYQSIDFWLMLAESSSCICTELWFIRQDGIRIGTILGPSELDLILLRLITRLHIEPGFTSFALHCIFLHYVYLLGKGESFTVGNLNAFGQSSKSRLKEPLSRFL